MRRGRCGRNFAHGFVAISAFAERLDAILHTLGPRERPSLRFRWLWTRYIAARRLCRGFPAASTSPDYWKSKRKNIKTVKRSCVEYISLSCTELFVYSGNEIQWEADFYDVYTSLVQRRGRRWTEEPKRFSKHKLLDLAKIDTLKNGD